jgi:hypothetical protein
MSEDKHHFAQAWNELDRGMVETGLWARAFAHGRGDEAAAKSEYLRLRVEELRQEEAAANLVELGMRASAGAYRARSAATRLLASAAGAGVRVLFLMIGLLAIVSLVTERSLDQLATNPYTALGSILVAVVAFAAWVKVLYRERTQTPFP